MEIIWDVVWAARVNVYFALASIPLGFVLAVMLAIPLAGPKGILRSFSAAYVYIFRGTPLFIQLYFAYSLFRVSGLPTYRLPADPGTFGTKILPSCSMRCSWGPSFCC